MLPPPKLFSALECPMQSYSFPASLCRFAVLPCISRHFLSRMAILVLCLATAALLHAETISGKVVDPSGAVIVGARIEITGGILTQPVVLTSDERGNFSSPDLKPGDYSVKVTREGFEPLVKTVALPATAELEFKLAIAKQREEVIVSGKGRAYANSDPVYRQLRNVGLGQTYRFDDFTVQVDTATFHFQKGTLTLLNPVNGVVTGAIYIGEGHFNLKPMTVLDEAELKRRSGSVEADEDFTEVIFRFTGDAPQKFTPGLKDKMETPGEAVTAFDRWKDKVRKRREEPLGLTEYLLHGESMDNVDADVLSGVYNAAHPPFVNAYIRGRKHKDLRYFMRTRVGAIPQLESPEEVALINYDPEAMDDGVWYLAHLRSEYDNRTASSSEDRRLFATRAYKIETIIGKNNHLFSTATISFQPLVPGERVMKFRLLPNLRVSRVMDEHGQDIYYVQESRKEDGAFYAILSQAPEIGKDVSITVQYEGDKVVDSAGDGSFYVRARSSWYTNLNGFGERVPYDLTFKVPKKYKLISIGKLKEETTEQDYAVTHWVTDQPVVIAGFNYGNYQRLDLPDDKTGFKISGYYLTELPDSLSAYPIFKTMAPKKMTNYVLEQTRAQLQLCNFFFGKIPYNEIYVTEQPNFSSGQSWPNLIYLPIVAYTDSTQRYMAFGKINSKLTGFVQEVTPHEVAHQWWGHAVMWASYHDQWLSEGFADFSAGLFLQQAVAGDWRGDYLEYWDRLKKRILEKNNWGIAPNDAGPLWMGLRLDSPRTEHAYENVTYPKGAYVLQMLRSIMYSPQDGDKPFIAMMHDFVESHRDTPASTESFKSIVQKHMSKTMDLAGNGRMDWFFNEWVYGTQIPKYHFDYQVTPAEGGKFNLHMTVTQSEVNDQFVMLVPVFADFGKGMVRIGQLGVHGNTTRTADVVLPMQPKKVALNAYKDILDR
jgi:Peptidase family M1 domain/Carboxypeptidase regulatory-like domain